MTGVPSRASASTQEWGSTMLSQTTRLTDADGHVLEDSMGIAERLTGGYREVRLAVLRGGAHSGMGGVFPSLGFLSNMPVKGTGINDFEKHERLSGREP